jgi:hypothetical protein
VTTLEDFAKREKIRVNQFRKEQRKDEVAAEQRTRVTEDEAVVFIGKAQGVVGGRRTSTPAADPAVTAATLDQFHEPV